MTVFIVLSTLAVGILRVFVFVCFILGSEKRSEFGWAGANRHRSCRICWEAAWTYLKQIDLEKRPTRSAPGIAPFILNATEAERDTIQVAAFDRCHEVSR